MKIEKIAIIIASTFWGGVVGAVIFFMLELKLL